MSGNIKDRSIRKSAREFKVDLNLLRACHEKE